MTTPIHDGCSSIVVILLVLTSAQLLQIYMTYALILRSLVIHHPAMDHSLRHPAWDAGHPAAGWFVADKCLAPPAGRPCLPCLHLSPPGPWPVLTAANAHYLSVGLQEIKGAGLITQDSCWQGAHACLHE